MEEEWRDVVGYEGLYKVSNLGRVKSLNYKRTRKEGIMIGEVIGTGYRQVFLIKDGIKKQKKVHRLVAEAFIPNPMGLSTVNHKNEIKTDNVVTNLEWLSFHDNLEYGTRNMRASLAKVNHPRFSKKVQQYTCDSVLLNEFPSVAEANRQTHVNGGHISECCRSLRSVAGGFIWRYKE